MYLTTTALVLREVEYKDSDKLLTVLTPEQGKLTLSARGVRKKKDATAAACLCIITALANVDPVISNAMGHLPIIGAISRVVTFRTFEDQ